MGLSNFLTGIVPTSTIQTEIYWKEMDGDSEWVWHAQNCGILLFILFLLIAVVLYVWVAFAYYSEH
jgi:hypothetical protein